MASKMNKQFKERINEERTKKNEGNKNISYEIKEGNFNNIVVVQMANKLIKVQSKRGVSRWDIQEYVEDLFSMGGCSEGENVLLSKFYDTTFDLVCSSVKMVNGIEETYMIVS